MTDQPDTTHYIKGDGHLIEREFAMHVTRREFQ